MKTINYLLLLGLILLINSISLSQTEQNYDSPKLLYSTFIGGSRNDGYSSWLKEFAIDSSGNIIFATDTESLDFPVSDNAYDKTYNGGNNWGTEDNVLISFNINENKLKYSSYFGGKNGPDFTRQIYIYKDNVLLSGNTGASDFPVTNNAYDNTFNGPVFRHSDSFISKFQNNVLVSSSFIGTSGIEFINKILFDSDNNMVLAGQLAKPDKFPVTHVYTSESLPDNPNCHLTKFNPAGDSVLSSILLGPVWEMDAVMDNAGYIYITGSTPSSRFPVTASSFDTTFNGGNETSGGDIFVCKFSPSCDSIIFSSFIGGTGNEFAPMIRLDKSNNIILLGKTNSSDFPLTHDAANVLLKGSSDLFISKLSNDGKKLIYSTLLGGTETGSANENAGNFCISDRGDLFICGTTNSNDFPVTLNALQNSNNGGTDIFITILDSTLKHSKFSTYLGAKADESNPAIRLDDNNNIICICTTQSTDFQITTNALYTSKNGGSDIALCKLSSLYNLQTVYNYYGQTPPGDEPVIFAPGTISVENKNSHALVISPDGNMIIFSRYPDGTSYILTKENDEWRGPVQSFFYGKEVSFSPDGKRIYYYTGGDIFYVENDSANWSQPFKLGPNINTNSLTEYYPSIVQNGDMYFSRDGNWSTGRIMHSRFLNGEFQPAEDLGLPINSGGASHAWVSPDESYILFNSPRTGSYTQNDIWISFKKDDGKWSQPLNAGPKINSGADAILCPTVSPDGRYMFFTKLNFNPNQGYIYWVSTGFIDSLRNTATQIKESENKTGSIRFELNQNYPNPFNPSTTISYNLPVHSKVKLNIYDTLGQEIKTLKDDLQNAGKYSIVWDATDSYNHPVSSGVYFYSLSVNGINLYKKMVFIR